LLNAIGWIAVTLGDWFGPWRENAAVARVFRHTVAKLLVLRGPPEPETFSPLHPRPGSLGAELFPGKVPVKSVISALAGASKRRIADGTWQYHKARRVEVASQIRSRRAGPGNG
jgi:hypothetical protein